MRCRARRILALPASLLATAIASDARAATRSWPGPACATTLQSCVDFAPAGDVVEIATQGPIDESISFLKPLTLRAAAGVLSRFAAFRSVIGGISEGTGGGTVRIEGLVMTGGAIRIFQGGSLPLEAELVGNTIETTVLGAPGLEIYTSGGDGFVAASVVGNRVTAPDVDGESRAISIALGGVDSASVAVVANEIAMGANAYGGAIEIAAQGSVDVFGNAIDGAGYGVGIGFTASGDATARFFNNVVSGQAGDVGAPAALAIDSAAFTTELQAGNNTLVNNETALFCTASAQQGGALAGGVENNVFAGNGRGLLRETPFVATVADASNLYFDNGVDVGDEEAPLAPGPGSVLADPLLDAALRPQPGSPAIDAGDTSFVPPDLPVDVAGQPRVQGLAVDIGAYEVPEPAAAPLAALAALWLARAGRHRSATRNA